MDLTYGPAIPLLGICLKKPEMLTGEKHAPCVRCGIADSGLETGAAWGPAGEDGGWKSCRARARVVLGCRKERNLTESILSSVK